MAAFHVSDPETDRLVRRLAERRSLGITEAINLAVCNELAKDDPEDEEPGTMTSATEGDLLRELDRVLRATTLDYTRLLAKHRGRKGGSRVYQMLGRHGPVETLRRLVARPTDGVAFLHSIDRLDLSAEQIAIAPRFKSIIPDDVRASAHENLAKVSRGR
jgi:hypothetical protein